MTDFYTNDNNSYGFYESPAYRVQKIWREADIGGVFTIIENEAQTRLDLTATSIFHTNDRIN